MKVPTSSLPPPIIKIVRNAGRYRVILFLVLVAGLYGYLVLQINKATSVPASDSQTAVSHSAPRIDPQVVSQLQQLQDNSVSVQALFNQARSNPFQ